VLHGGFITARHRQPSVTESSVALPPQYRSIQGESTVSSTQQFLTAIERPRCPRCQTRMMLERVSSGPIGFEQRLFECPKCVHVEISVIASDPFKSKPAGWLANILRALNLGRAMLDRQNQGPQCTACDSPMKLTAIEPAGVGQDRRFFTCPHCRMVQGHIIDSAVTEAWVGPQR
jgi:hypothetical protein